MTAPTNSGTWFGFTAGPIAGVLGRVIGTKARREGWLEQIRQVISSLGKMNEVTEGNFLMVGERLASFTGMSRQIAGDVGELVELLSDHQAEAASATLVKALAESQGMLHRAEANGVALDGLRKSAHEIRLNLAGFEGVIASFRTVGSLTRIETARLNRGEGDFGNLAEAVRNLTETIQERVARTLEAAALLERDIRAALENIARGDQLQRKELPALIAGVTADIATFRAARQRASETSVTLARRYDSLTGALRDLTVSIQFHDITRQQVEHVLEALRTLRPDSQGPVSPVIRLQASQLSNSAATFAGAVAKVDRSLSELSLQIDDMARESSGLMGVTADERDSFFLDMERRLTVLLTQLGTCAVADTETQAAVAGLDKAVERMRDSVADIREIEMQIERLALNATIRATLLGRPGDALNVVAEAMQAHARECGSLSDKSIRALDTMSSAIAGVIAHAGGAEIGGTGSELPELIRALHASSERSFSRVGQIGSLAERLNHEVASVRQEFRVGEVFVAAVEPALEVLRTAAAAAAKQRGESGEAALANYAGNYTMRAERDVHERVAVGAADYAAESVAAVVGGEDDIDSNVEFF